MINAMLLVIFICGGLALIGCYLEYEREERQALHVWFGCMAIVLAFLLLIGYLTGDFGIWIK